jgi:nitrogen fixation/metabolism regulation signal transduction histidine kinase
MKVDRDEALAMLSSTSAHARGQAARALSEVGVPGDLTAIRRSLRRETVSYVQYALQDTIKRLTNKILPASEHVDDTADVPLEVRQQIYGQAVEWVTGSLLHEIASPFGLVTVSAKREIGKDWEISKTRRHLETIHRVFGAIEMLKSAAGVPRPQEFDLAALLQEFVEAEMPDALPWISPIGPKPFVLKGDPALIRMAVSNGIRNAIESVQASDVEPAEHAIVINWGATEADYWVSVLDRGVGLAGPVESAFDIGRSTKQNHSGFGLAIARQAINTLTGTVNLEPARGGGAVYTARWKR